MIRSRWQVVAVDAFSGFPLPEIPPVLCVTRRGAFRLLSRLEAARRSTSWVYSVEERAA